MVFIHILEVDMCIHYASIVLTLSFQTPTIIRDDKRLYKINDLTTIRGLIAPRGIALKVAAVQILS